VLFLFVHTHQIARRFYFGIRKCIRMRAILRFSLRLPGLGQFYSTLTKYPNHDILAEKKERYTMPSPLSKDLRERIVVKHQKGMKPVQIQSELEIKSLSTVCGIIKRYTETGSIEPRPLNNGRPAKMTPQNKEDLKAAVLLQPDITLEEVKERLNLPVCISRICRILNRELDLPRKKNSLPAKSEASGCSQKT